MTTDLSLPCLRCGRPAAPEHHHREGPGPKGKGMGGTHEHLPTVPLCREHHESLHRSEWGFRIEGGLVQGYEDDPKWIVFERGLELSDNAKDPLCWTDERLASEWERGETEALGALRRQCVIAHVLYRRYGWAERWYERAAEIIADFTGRYTHWRRVYERISIYEAFGPSAEYPEGRWEDLEYLGNMLALAVAESAEPLKALEVAKEGRAEGLPSKDIVALLKEVPPGGETDHQIADRAIEWCVCGEGEPCGQKHRRKGE